MGTVVSRPFAGIPLVLGDATYRPWFLIFLCAGVNGGLWLNFLPLWLTDNLGASPTQVGWFFSAGFLAAALGNVTMPPLAERLGNRRLVAQAMMLISAPAMLGLVFANGYWMALISVLPFWFGAAVFSLLIGLAGDTARGRAAAGERDFTGAVVAALQTGLGLGNAVAPLLGGWIYETTGDLRPVILLGMVPGTLATWLVWRHVRNAQPGDAPHQPDVSHRPRAAPMPALAASSAQPAGAAPAAASLVRAAGLALPLFLLAQVLFKLGDSRGAFETLFAAPELGASRTAVGVLVTLAGGMLLVLTPLAGVLTDRWGPGGVTALGMALAGMHGLLLVAVTAFWQQLAVLAVLEAGLAIGTTAPLIYAQRLAPGRAATATGWANACIFLGLCVGNPLAGRVVEVAGFRGLFAISGAVDLLGAGLVMMLVVLGSRR